jgi:hypothetical protein
MPTADSSDSDKAAPKSAPFAGLYDVKSVLGDKARLQEFSIQLWCAMTGRSRKEALQVDAEAEEREATYGPPLEAPDVPWPDEAVCDGCGATARPFGSFVSYETDVPQHRWVRRYRCTRCEDEHFRRKWLAIGGALAKRRGEAGGDDQT